VFVLMSFAAARLHEQAERRGCTVGELLNTYDRAIDRLRARACPCDDWRRAGLRAQGERMNAGPF